MEVDLLRMNEKLSIKFVVQGTVCSSIRETLFFFYNLRLRITQCSDRRTVTSRARKKSTRDVNYLIRCLCTLALLYATAHQTVRQWWDSLIINPQVPRRVRGWSSLITSCGCYCHWERQRLLLSLYNIGAPAKKAFGAPHWKTKSFLRPILSLRTFQAYLLFTARNEVTIFGPPGETGTGTKH